MLQHRKDLLSYVTKDGKNGNGLKFKYWQAVSSSKTVSVASLPKTFLRFVLPAEIHYKLKFALAGAFCVCVKVQRKRRLTQF